MFSAVATNFYICQRTNLQKVIPTMEISYWISATTFYLLDVKNTWKSANQKENIFQVFDNFRVSKLTSYNIRVEITLGDFQRKKVGKNF